MEQGPRLEQSEKTYNLTPKEICVIKDQLLHYKQDLGNAVGIEISKGKSFEGDKHPYIHTNETVVRKLEDEIAFVDKLLKKLE